MSLRLIKVSCAPRIHRFPPLPCRILQSPVRSMATTPTRQGSDLVNRGSDQDAVQTIASPTRTAAQHRSAPTSLVQHGNQKGYFSVTDLTSPLWCEYAFQYGIIGMRHLPVSERPTEIKTETGHVVRPDLKTAQKREKILVGGRKVHEKLEREVHPVKVHVRTTTREDAWGLRILRLVTGLKVLLDTGRCRELPVFGFVHGRLIMGVIDEISRGPLSKRLNRYLDEADSARKEVQGPTLQNFFTISKATNKAGAAADDNDHDSVSESKGSKKWASQEEWKKEKRKSESAASGKKAKGVKPTKKQKPNDPVDEQRGIAAFFSSQDNPKDKAVDHKDTQQQATATKERLGYFLEDSKTRMARLLPPIEDQEQSRLQCMLYRRLFDGLLLGSLRSHATLTNTKEAETLATDSNATPLDLDILFSSLGLDVDATLSEEFVRDAEQLIVDHELAFGESSSPQVLYTLKTLSSLAQDVLLDLARSAREGLGWQSSSNVQSGVLQNHLRLTYRKRKGKFTRRQGSKAVAAAKEDGSAEASFDLDESSSDDANEDIQMAIAMQIGIETPMEEALVEDEMLLNNGITLPASSPSVPHTNRNRQVGGKVEEDKKPEKSDVIGTVTFLHDSERLEAHLNDMFRMWKGERALRGVTLEQSWRCHSCEFRHDCEWRQTKGQERLDEVQKTKMVRAGLDWLSAKASREADDKERSGSTDDEEQGARNVGTVSRIDLDDEESLWSQFQDIAEESLDG